MEPAQLQLMFNVVTITGVSSLASFCYLLRKENQKLATELETDLHRKQRDHLVKAAQSVAIGRLRTDLSRQCTLPAARTVPAQKEDLRAFAAGRRMEWVEGLASSISCDHAPDRRNRASQVEKQIRPS
jgi:hypothetical protein